MFGCEQKKGMKKIAGLVLIFWMALLPDLSVAEPVHLKINCTIHSPYEAFFFRMVEEICSQISISVERNDPPVGRSLINVNSGLQDGDGPRIGGLSSTYPNLIHIPEPFGSFSFGAFSQSDQIKIDGWESLSGLNVAYIHGWKIFDNHVKTAKTITKVKNADLLFTLLENKRTDVVLISKLAGYGTIRKLGLKGVQFIEPALAIEPNFLYLNKRHEHLVPILTETLKKMKQDGTYEKIYAEMISPWLSEK